MGGGAQYLGMNVEPIDFDSCVRSDGRNLIKEWQANHAKGRVVNNTQDLMSIDINDTSHILGVFSPNHMPYHAVKSAETPSLVNMTTQAIKLLKKNKNGFLLMVSNRHWTVLNIYIKCKLDCDAEPSIMRTMLDKY